LLIHKIRWRNRERSLFWIRKFRSWGILHLLWFNMERKLKSSSKKRNKS